MKEEPRFGFTEGLSIASRDGEKAYLYYDFNDSIYLNVVIEASIYVVHTAYPFACSHVEIVPQSGKNFVVAINRIDDQNFTFTVPPGTGPFTVIPD